MTTRTEEQLARHRARERTRYGEEEEDQRVLRQQSNRTSHWKQRRLASAADRMQLLGTRSELSYLLELREVSEADDANIAAHFDKDAHAALLLLALSTPVTEAFAPRTTRPMTDGTGLDRALLAAFGDPRHETSDPSARVVDPKALAHGVHHTHQAACIGVPKHENAAGRTIPASGFFADVDLHAELVSCAACGVRQFEHGGNDYAMLPLSHPFIQKLAYTPDQTEDFDSRSLIYRILKSSYLHNGVRYHLHRELVQPAADAEDNCPTAQICSTCHDALSNNKLPKLSIAAGVDYGD